MLQRGVTLPPPRRHSPLGLATVLWLAGALLLVKGAVAPRDAAPPPPPPIVESPPPPPPHVGCPAPDAIVGQPFDGNLADGLGASTRSDDGCALAAWYETTLEVSWDGGATFTHYAVDRIAFLGERITSRRLVWPMQGRLAIVEPGDAAVRWIDLAPLGLTASDTSFWVETAGDWIAFEHAGRVFATRDDGAHWFSLDLPPHPDAFGDWSVSIRADGTLHAEVDDAVGKPTRDCPDEVPPLATHVYEGSAATGAWREVPDDRPPELVGGWSYETPGYPLAHCDENWSLVAIHGKRRVTVAKWLGYIELVTGNGHAFAKYDGVIYELHGAKLHEIGHLEVQLLVVDPAGALIARSEGAIVRWTARGGWRVLFRVPPATAARASRDALPGRPRH
ncbi:MAG TPA: hypothetical protein VGM88_08810 [Kofleriaceae bacterium]|jgi:hypothetical protein